MVERVRPAEIVRRAKQRGNRFPRGRLGTRLPDVRSAGLARFFLPNPDCQVRETPPVTRPAPALAMLPPDCRRSRLRAAAHLAI